MRELLVVGLVLVAGCSGVSGVDLGGIDGDTGTATPTLTPVSVSEPETPSPTPTAQPSVSPGVGPNRVRDPFTLASTHAFVVSNRSFRFTDALTVRNSTGELRYEQNRRVTVEGAEFLIHETITGPRAAAIRSPPGTFDLYSDGTQFRSRFTTENETSYSRAEGGSYVQQREVYNPPPYQGRLFAVFAIPDNWTVDTDPVRLTGRTNATRPGPLGPGTTARNLTVTATVVHGLVSEWAVRYETTVDGDTVVVVRTVRYSDVGETTVSRPTWYAKAE